MVSVNVGREKRAKAASGSTGIPGAVQAKFEAASGLSFDDVRVHYNSSRPAQLGAYAYTQGSQVYIGPGQERHLEHELGHVIQQKRGLVKADGYIGGVPVNRDPGLERAADLGASQPVQGFWKRPFGGVVQMMPPKPQTTASAPGTGSGSSSTSGITLPPQYALSDATLQTHIEPRHAHDSKFTDKSHFDRGFDIRDGIQSTWSDKDTSSVVITPNTANRPGYILIKDFGQRIGVNNEGTAVSRLKMVINDQGNVITAFPV